MNKKGINIELKIYESLGIKTFRKIAFKRAELAIVPFTLKKSKEERKAMIFNVPSNYIMKKGHGIQDLRDFKKQLLINAGVHIYGLIIWGNLLLKAICEMVSLFIPISIFFILINTYCIMLQRYNHIRINQVIKKWKLREENKKRKLATASIKEDSLLSEHTNKIVNKSDKEEDINFEELLENATSEQLKQCRDYLSIFKEASQMMEEQSSISVPLQKTKH